MATRALKDLVNGLSIGTPPTTTGQVSDINIGGLRSSPLCIYWTTIDDTIPFQNGTDIEIPHFSCVYVQSMINFDGFMIVPQGVVTFVGIYATASGLIKENDTTNIIKPTVSHSGMINFDGMFLENRSVGNAFVLESQSANTSWAILRGFMGTGFYRMGTYHSLIMSELSVNNCHVQIRNVQPASSPASVTISDIKAVADGIDLISIDANATVDRLTVENMSGSCINGGSFIAKVNPTTSIIESGLIQDCTISTDGSDPFGNFDEKEDKVIFTGNRVDAVELASNTNSTALFDVSNPGDVSSNPNTFTTISDSGDEITWGQSIDSERFVLDDPDTGDLEYVGPGEHLSIVGDAVFERTSGSSYLLTLGVSLNNNVNMASLITVTAQNIRQFLVCRRISVFLEPGDIIGVRFLTQGHETTNFYGASVNAIT